MFVESDWGSLPIVRFLSVVVYLFVYADAELVFAEVDTAENTCRYTSENGEESL